MTKFVILKDKDRIRLFERAKKNTKLSFNKLPKLLNISRTSFFNYYSRHWPIPLDVYRSLEKIAKLSLKNFKIIKKKRFLRNEPKIPKLNKALAEILGAINGDGHLSKYKYEVAVTSDKNEEDYHRYLKNLFENTFRIQTSSFNQGGVIKLRCYSIDIHNFLSNDYCLPVGKKKGKLKIPNQIFSSKYLLIHYIRGLFDTDGSIYFRRKNEPVLEISSADPNFLREIMDALKFLEFKVAKGQNRVFIYRKKHISRFFKIIKPANSKHLKKYQNYLES